MTGPSRPKPHRYFEKVRLMRASAWRRRTEGNHEMADKIDAIADGWEKAGLKSERDDNE